MSAPELTDRFTGLYQAGYDRLAAFCARQVRGQDGLTGEDLAQKAFTLLWERLPGLVELSDGQLLAWVFTAARHALLNHRRLCRTRYERTADKDAVVWRSASVDTVLPDADELAAREQVFAAMQALPERTRQVLTLRVANAMTQQAVRGALHMHRSTIQRLVSEGVAELREAYAAVAA